jgi:hypothetical protein
MDFSLRSLIALAFPALAFLSSVLGHRVGLSLRWQQILSACIIGLAVFVTAKVLQASKPKTRSKCKGLTLDGEPCKNWASAGEQYCRQHERNAPRLSGFVRKNFGHTIAAVSLALTIYFGNQIPALITNFQPPNLATVLQKPTLPMTATLKRSKVEPAVLRIKRPALPAGMTAASESLASEAPALPTGLSGLAAAQLPPDLMLFISGQRVMPTLVAVEKALAGAPSAPTNLTAQVQ